MRGVASGGDGNHSGSLPSVGIYLDEQPITTIQGALDVHLYDIARVESLAGQQGTLYGASSQAGTLRPPFLAGLSRWYRVFPFRGGQSPRPPLHQPLQDLYRKLVPTHMVDFPNDGSFFPFWPLR